MLSLKFLGERLSLGFTGNRNSYGISLLLPSLRRTATQGGQPYLAWCSWAWHGPEVGLQCVLRRPQEHGKAGSGTATCTSGWQRSKGSPTAFENEALGKFVDSVTCSHSCGKSSPSPVVMLQPQRPSPPMFAK